MLVQLFSFPVNVLMLKVWHMHINTETTGFDDEVSLMQKWSFHVAASHEFEYFCSAKLSCVGTWSHFRLWFIYQFNNFALYSC
jgi:hypothetical protein